MLIKISKLFAVVLLTLVVSACSTSQFSHEYLMKGQVVSTNNDDVIVCIGTADGATVGQELAAYRFTVEQGAEEGSEYYNKVKIGHIKIQAIINKHFARATVLDGDIQDNDMVELTR